MSAAHGIQRPVGTDQSAPARNSAASDNNAMASTVDDRMGPKPNATVQNADRRRSGAPVEELECNSLEPGAPSKVDDLALGDAGGDLTTRQPYRASTATYRPRLRPT